MHQSKVESYDDFHPSRCGTRASLLFIYPAPETKSDKPGSKTKTRIIEKINSHGSHQLLKVSIYIF